MAALLKPAIAADHARFVGELSEYGTLDGRAVDSWHEETSADGRQVLLSVVYAQTSAASWVQSEVYVFSARNVAELEGKQTI